MRWVVALILVMICAAATFGQELEDWIEKSDHPDDLHEWIEDLRRAPLDLNAATVGQLAALPMFDAETARSVVEQREQSGGFRSVKEALNCAVLSPGQRQVLRELTVVSESVIAEPQSVRSYLTIEQQGAPDGQLSPEQSSARLQAAFQGERQIGYLYARHAADNPDVVEQAAVGLQIRPRDIPAKILLGDFQYEAGTGLVFASAYGSANWLNSPYETKVEDSPGLVLRPSSNRRALLRGAAVNWKNFWVEATAVGSTTTLDAVISEGGVERVTEGETSSAELSQARRDQMRESLAGFTAALSREHVRMGSAGYVAQFSPPFADVPEGPSALSGKRLRVGSVFAQASTRGVNATGELAASRPGGKAWQAAVAWDQNALSMSLWHVQADADFQSPRSRVWGGFGDEANNIEGSGVRLRAITGRHVLWLAGSTQRTPFRTSTSPLSLSSSDLEMRWTVRLSDAVEGEALIGRNQREDVSEHDPARDVYVDRVRGEIRFRQEEDYKIRIELRSADGNGHQTGTLLFTQGKTRVYGLELFGRLTYFHLDGNDLRTATYENAFAGSYPLVALTGSGARAAFIIRRQWSSVALSAKAALTEKSGSESDRRSADAAFTVSFRQ